MEKRLQIVGQLEVLAVVKLSVFERRIHKQLYVSAKQGRKRFQNTAWEALVITFFKNVLQVRNPQYQPNFEAGGFGQKRHQTVVLVVVGNHYRLANRTQDVHAV